MSGVPRAACCLQPQVLPSYQAGQAALNSLQGLLVYGALYSLCCHIMNASSCGVLQLCCCRHRLGQWSVRGVSNRLVLSRSGGLDPRPRQLARRAPSMHRRCRHLQCGWVCSGQQEYVCCGDAVNAGGSFGLHSVRGQLHDQCSWLEQQRGML